MRRIEPLADGLQMVEGCRHLTRIDPSGEIVYLGDWIILMPKNERPDGRVKRLKVEILHDPDHAQCEHLRSAVLVFLRHANRCPHRIRQAESLHSGLV